MCFIIHSEHRTVKVATKNIVCYKRYSLFQQDRPKKLTRSNITNIPLYSPYFAQRVNPGITLCSRLKKVNQWEIEEGLHSYSDLQTAYNLRWGSEIIVKCIVPKGAKYFYDPRCNEYVSNKLTVGKKILKTKFLRILINDSKLYFTLK